MRSADGPFVLNWIATCALVFVTASASLAQEPDDGGQIGPAVVDGDPGPQRPADRSRTSVADLLAGRPMPRSVGELSTVLKPGHEISVRDETGRTVTGRVSAISEDKITVFAEGSTPLLRMIRPARTYAFAADSITRIEVVDSTANGVLIGAAVGAGLMYGLVETNKDELATNNMAPAVYMFFAAVSFGPSILVGQLIDRSRNAPIYERQSRPPRVTLSPLLGRARAGVVARVVF